MYLFNLGGTEKEKSSVFHLSIQQLHGHHITDRKACLFPAFLFSHFNFFDYFLCLSFFSNYLFQKKDGEKYEFEEMFVLNNFELHDYYYDKEKFIVR
jgi:hypothetical protein